MVGSAQPPPPQASTRVPTPAQAAQPPSDRASGPAQPGSGRGDRLGALHAVMSFLSALTAADEDGRVVVTPAPAAGRGPPPLVGEAEARGGGGVAGGGGGGSLKYVLLNAASKFAQVLGRCRAVVLASGTLTPVEGLVSQLFPEASPLPSLHALPPPMRQLLASCPAQLLGVLPATAAAARAGEGPRVQAEVGGSVDSASEQLPQHPPLKPLLHFECGGWCQAASAHVLSAPHQPLSQELNLLLRNTMPNHPLHPSNRSCGGPGGSGCRSGAARPHGATAGAAPRVPGQ